MAQELDPVPAEESRRRGLSLTVKHLPNALRKTKRASSQIVSFQEYEDLVADRPEKFNQDDVGYQEAEGQERCGGCFHFFRQAGGRQRTVCEILRLDPEDDIDPEYQCRFFTVDGSEFPLLEEGKKHGTKTPQGTG